MTTEYPFEEAVKVGNILRNPAIPSRKKNELRARLPEILPPENLFHVTICFEILVSELEELIPLKPKTKGITESIKLLRQDLEAARHAIAAILTKNFSEYDWDSTWEMLYSMNSSCEALDKKMKAGRL